MTSSGIWSTTILLHWIRKTEDFVWEIIFYVFFTPSSFFFREALAKCNQKKKNTITYSWRSGIRITVWGHTVAATFRIYKHDKAYKCNFLVIIVIYRLFYGFFWNFSLKTHFIFIIYFWKYTVNRFVCSHIIKLSEHICMS